MNIAVILTKDIREGGSFQYSLSKMLLLEKKRGGAYNFLFFTTKKENVSYLKKHNINAIYFSWNNFDEFLSQINRQQLVSNILRKLKVGHFNKLDRLLKRQKVDLVYFVSPTPLALAIEQFNFIFTAWDLCFRDHMEFPEVYADREFERREELYGLALRKAVQVITDSDFIKETIIRRYGIDEGRVTSLPLSPQDSVNISKDKHKQGGVDIKKKYGIIGDYVFYPAQFWPHKNHIYILEGLKILKEKYGKNINAVFSGADKGNLGFIRKKALEFGISSQVYYIGFVNDTEIPDLYRQAMALVMPTYFGPTNIPPLEAFAIGCPVLYSDLPGLREQVKDAALLLDLNNPESMSQQLMKVIAKDPQVDKLLENGRRKIELFEAEGYWRKLENIFDNYALKLKCWK